MKYVVNPDSLSDPKLIQNLLANAQKREEFELAKSCRRRIANLAGLPFEDPMERRFWQIVGAFEQLKTEENGRATRSSQTRLKAAKVGIVKTVEDLLNQAKPAVGLLQLKDAGLGAYAFECLALEFPDQFSEKALAGAKSRLLENEMALPDAA